MSSSNKKFRPNDQRQWKVVGKQGNISRVDVNDLYDPSYQRQVIPSHRGFKGKEFNLTLCGVISVAERNKKKYILDGLQRVAAAKAAGVRYLLCIIHKFDDIEAEAQAFIDGNMNRHGLNASDQFIGLVIANNQDAVSLNMLLRKYNIDVTNDSGRKNSIKAIHTLFKWWVRDKDAVMRVFPEIVRLFKGAQLNGEVLEAIIHLESVMFKEGQKNPELSDSAKVKETLTSQVYSNRLMKQNVKDIIEAIHRMKRLHTSSQGSSRHGAYALQDMLNKGCRNLISAVTLGPKTKNRV